MRNIICGGCLLRYVKQKGGFGLWVLIIGGDFLLEPLFSFFFYFLVHVNENTREKIKNKEVEKLFYEHMILNK